MVPSLEAQVRKLRHREVAGGFTPGHRGSSCHRSDLLVDLKATVKVVVLSGLFASVYVLCPGPQGLTSLSDALEPH